MRRNKENLKKISELCDYLSDRDSKMKEEYQLLLKLIESIPIKIFAIKISKDLTVEHHLGNGNYNLSGKKISELFSKETDYLISCQESMKGEITKSKIKINNIIFDCISKPVKNNDGPIDSVISVAWSTEV